MANSSDKRKLSNWLKMAVIAIVAFTGGLGGIYFGQAVLGKTRTAETPGFGPTNQKMTDQYVTFEPGDLFPPEDFFDSTGQVGTFSVLIGENGSVIIFVGFSCHSCLELLEFWQKNLSTRINSEVKVIAAIDMIDETRVIPPEYTGLFDGMEIVWIDTKFWIEKYELSFRPTIIGVDGSGFVIHVQPGFGNYLDHALATYFLKANQ